MRVHKVAGATATSVTSLAGQLLHYTPAPPSYMSGTVGYNRMKFACVLDANLKQSGLPIHCLLIYHCHHTTALQLPILLPQNELCQH